VLTCKEASFLASKKMDSPLTWRERFGLRLHISLCSICRAYLADLKRLRLMLRRAGVAGQTPLLANVQLPEQARARIQQALHEADHSHD
jgi:hypothetical protein